MIAPPTTRPTTLEEFERLPVGPPNFEFEQPAEAGEPTAGEARAANVPMPADTQAQTGAAQTKTGTETQEAGGAGIGA